MYLPIIVSGAPDTNTRRYCWLIEWLMDGLSFNPFLVFSCLLRLPLVLTFFPPLKWQERLGDQDQWPSPRRCRPCPCFCFRSFLKCKSLHFLCEKEREEKRECENKKINRFPLSGWAVSLACQWSRYSPGTRVRRAPSQSPLTRGKHADSNQEQVRTQICTSSARPRGRCEGATKRRRARLRLIGGHGRGGSGRVFTPCLNVSLPLTNAFILPSIIYLWIHQRKPRCTDCGQEKFITFVVATSSSSLFRSFSFSPLCYPSPRPTK